MADKQYQDDLAMEDYFENGTLRDADEGASGIPAATTNKKSRIPSGKRKRRADRGKKLLMVGVGVLAVALVLWMIISISKKRNNGAKYAERYSKCIGATMSDAMSNVKLGMYSESQYPQLDQAYQPFTNCAVSKKKTEILGVTLPQWMILCNADDSQLTDIWFYDYRVLEDNPYGTKRKAYLETAEITDPTDPESQLGLKPYCTHYLPDHTQVREYRYCFENAETGDMTAYIIAAEFDNQGNMTSISDRKVDFLSAIIKTSLN